VVAGGAGVSGNVNMGNNLSVVGDIDTTRFILIHECECEIRWNSKQQFYIRTISQRIIVLDFVIRGTDR
jgi:hypothetical protein